MGRLQKQKELDNIWLKVHGNDLYISPAGTNEEYFLTNKKITMKKIKNYQSQRSLWTLKKLKNL